MVLRTAATESPFTADRSRRCLFWSVVLSVLLGSWGQAWSFLEQFGRHPFDGSALSLNTAKAFTAMGLVVGMTIGVSFTLSRQAIHRTILSGSIGALAVWEMVALCGPDCFSTRLNQSYPGDALLDFPKMWALALGAPVCSTLALTIHLLQRMSGKLRLTLLAIALLVLIGLRSQWQFWQHWGYRAMTNSGMCGTAAGNWMDGIADAGRMSSLIFSLYVAQGILFLDFLFYWLGGRPNSK